MSFWCITCVFNPAGYKSRIENYHTFRERLEKQRVNLVTVELTFPGQYPIITDAIHLNSNSIMWQKERLLNHAINSLPPSCDKFAWLDCDLLLPDGWDEQVVDKLENISFLQPFQEIAHLKPGERQFNGEIETVKLGIAWQYKTHNHWLSLRINKKIPHAEPGFGWAARRDALPNGLYDKLICGSGDNFLADCLFDSEPIHHYWSKINDHMTKDMKEWKENFKKKPVDYLPLQVKHLWHGSIRDRGYMTRELILKQHDYDPKNDIKIVNNVWEWSSNKPAFHQAIIDYFRSRKEDANTA